MTKASLHPWRALVVISIAFAIQCFAIRGTNLGLDGGLSLALAVVPVPDALRFLAHDVHPPLYYVALRGWLALVGAHPFAVKFFGLGFATLGVAAFFAWTRRLLGPRAAVRSALLLSLSSILVGDAATVRDLAPGLFLVILNCWAYCEARREPLRGRWTYLYVGTGVLAVWTSFLVVGILIGQAIHLGSRRSKPNLALPIVLIGLSIVPWTTFSVAQGWLSTLASGGPTTESAAPAFLANLRSAVALLTTGSDSTRGLILLAVLGLVVLVLGPALRRRREIPLLGFIALEAAITLVFALGISSTWLRLGVPSRYLGTVLPFWLLLVVALAEWAGQWRTKFALVTILAVNVMSLLSWYHQPTLPASFWNPSGMQKFLDRRLARGDHVVFLTLEQAGYYEALSPSPHPWVAVPVGTGYLERSATADASQQLTPLLGTNGTIWLVEYRGVLGSGQRDVDAWLARRAYPVGATALSDSDVHPYLTGASVGPDRPLDTRFADGVHLVAIAFPSTVRAGDVFPIRLIWHADRPLARDLTVFVHLVDQRGQTVAQQDAKPVAGLEPSTRWQGTIVDRHGLAIPATAAPGDYWIEVGLYDAAGRLAVQGRSDGTVRLGPFAIEKHPSL